MDQFEKDFEKETGGQAIEAYKFESLSVCGYWGPYKVIPKYAVEYIEYLKNRLKDEIEKNRQLIEYSKL